MPKKKRHHYVPRFYLKRFSVGGENTHLSLYNYKSRVFVHKAALAHQAYEDYLYGPDPIVEDMLAELEGQIGVMFNYWTEERLLYVPPTDSNGFKLLKRFILYQLFRTPKSGNELIRNINDGIKYILAETNPNLWERIKDGKITNDNPVLFALLNAIQRENLLSHLDIRFIVNLSELPFITSDSPIILYNQLMEAAGNYIGATGLVAKGLQIFYPIHPRVMICLYDPLVYNVGNSCKNCCEIDSADEVHQLNSLQFINSESQLFFDDRITQEYIEYLVEHNECLKGKSNNMNKFIYRDGKKFLFTATLGVPINLKLKSIKLIANIEEFQTKICPLRHPSLERS